MSGNDNEPLGIECEVLEMPGPQFLVEAVNAGSEGEIYRAIFDGQDAKARALAYAAAEYGHNGILMGPPTGVAPRPRPPLTVVPNADTSEPTDLAREDHP